MTKKYTPCYLRIVATREELLSIGIVSLSTGDIVQSYNPPRDGIYWGVASNDGRGWCINEEYLERG